MVARCPRSARTLLLALLLLPLLVPLHGTSAGDDGLGGFTYSSPSYGYAIGWRAPWFAVGAETRREPLMDTLTLADSASALTISGIDLSAFGDAELDEVTDLFLESIDDETGFTNRAPISPFRCKRETSELPSEMRCFTFDQQLPDGSALPMSAKLQIWELAGDVHALMIAYVAQDRFDTYVGLWSDLAIVPPEEPLPPELERGAVETDGQTTFVFDGTIDEAARTEVMDGFAFAATALRGYFGGLDENALRVTVLDAISPESRWMAAVTLERSIAIFAGADGEWDTSSPAMRRAIVTHELAHIYQLDMLGDRFGEVPRWFIEGSADMVAASAVADAGLATMDDFDALAGYQLTQTPVTERLDELPVSDVIAGDQYPLAFLGVRHAIEHYGVSVQAIGALLHGVAAGASFADAFEMTFGASIEEYYVEFEAWRSELSPVEERPEVFVL